MLLVILYFCAFLYYYVRIIQTIKYKTTEQERPISAWLQMTLLYNCHIFSVISLELIVVCFEKVMICNIIMLCVGLFIFTLETNL